MNLEHWFRYAYALAATGPDKSSQTSALIINPQTELLLADAVNRFPIGVASTDERWQRPLKYTYVEHAERNAIYMAARYQHRTSGNVMISPWAACADCARGIVQAGIRILYTHRHGPNPPHWEESIRLADGILREGGVELVIAEPIKGCVPILRNGELWDPSPRDSDPLPFDPDNKSGFYS